VRFEVGFLEKYNIYVEAVDLIGGAWSVEVADEVGLDKFGCLCYNQVKQ